MLRGLLFLSLGCLPSSAAAAIISFSFSGALNYQIDPSGLDEIGLGAPISAEFSIDSDAVTLGGCIPLGGGRACTYYADMLDYTITIGSYSKQYALLNSALYIHNDVFGGDAIGFAYTEVVAGPFGSDLTGLQWQGSFSSNLLESEHFSADVAFQQANWGLFAFFRTPAGQTHLRGPLEADIRSLSVLEPSSWALIVLGFGIIGFAMRRRGEKLRACEQYA